MKNKKSYCNYMLIIFAILHQTKSSSNNECTIASTFKDTFFLINCVMEELNTNLFGEGRTDKETDDVIEITLKTGLKSIGNFSFNKVPSLTKLDLKENNITSLAPYAFDGLKELVFLYLNNNNIRFLPENIFMELEGLFYLDLSVNQFTSFEFTLVKNNRNLNSLQLQDNPIIRYTTTGSVEMGVMQILNTLNSSAIRICISDLPDMPLLKKLSMDMKHLSYDESSNIRKNFPKILKINDYQNLNSTNYSFTCEKQYPLVEELDRTMNKSIKKMQAQCAASIMKITANLTVQQKEIENLNRITVDLVAEQQKQFNTTKLNVESQHEQALKARDDSCENAKKTAIKSSTEEKQKKMDQLENEINNQKQQLNEQNSTKIAYEEEIKNSTATINRLNGLLESLKTERANATDELTNQILNVKQELELQQKNYNETIEQLKRTMKQLNYDNDELTNHLNTKNAMLMKQERLVKEKTQEMNELKNENEQLTMKAKRNLEDAEEACNNPLENEKKTLRETNAQQDRLNVQLTSNIADLSEKHRLLEANCTQLKNKCTMWLEMQESVLEIQKIETSIMTETIQLTQEKDQEIHQLKNKITNLHQELNDATTVPNTHTTEMKELRKRCDETIQLTQEKDQEIHQLKNKITNLHQELNDATTVPNTHTTEMKELRKRCDETIQLTQEKEQEIHQLKNNITNLYQELNKATQTREMKEIQKKCIPTIDSEHESNIGISNNETQQNENKKWSSIFTHIRTMTNLATKCSDTEIEITKITNQLIRDLGSLKTDEKQLHIRINECQLQISKSDENQQLTNKLSEWIIKKVQLPNSQNPTQITNNIMLPGILAYAQPQIPSEIDKIRTKEIEVKDNPKSEEAKTSTLLETIIKTIGNGKVNFVYQSKDFDGKKDTTVHTQIAGGRCDTNDDTSNTSNDTNEGAGDNIM